MTAPPAWLYSQIATITPNIPGVDALSIPTEGTGSPFALPCVLQAHQGEQGANRQVESDQIQGVKQWLLRTASDPGVNADSTVVVSDSGNTFSVTLKTKAPSKPIRRNLRTGAAVVWAMACEEQQ